MTDFLQQNLNKPEMILIFNEGVSGVTASVVTRVVVRNNRVTFDDSISSWPVHEIISNSAPSAYLAIHTALPAFSCETRFHAKRSKESLAKHTSSFELRAAFRVGFSQIFTLGSVFEIPALPLLRKYLTGKGYFARNPDSHLILTS